jgi:hypothetical protein
VRALPGQAAVPVRLTGLVRNAAGEGASILVGTCAELRSVAGLADCRDGEVHAPADLDGYRPAAGERVWFGETRQADPMTPPQWTDVHPVPAVGAERAALFVTRPRWQRRRVLV